MVAYIIFQFKKTSRDMGPLQLNIYVGQNTLSIITSSDRLNSRLSRTYFVVHALARCFCTMWLFIGCKGPIPLSAYSLKWMKSMRKWQNDRDMFCRCIYIVDVYNQTQNKTKKGSFIIHIPGWWVHIYGLLIIPTKQRRLSVLDSYFGRQQYVIYCSRPK